MKRNKNIYSIFILLVTLSMCNMTGCFDACSREGKILRNAKSRVNAILSGITDDGSGAPQNEQMAACRWWRDAGFISDLDELSTATNAFDKWRLAMSIYPTIEHYSVDDAKILTDESTDRHAVVLVYVKINGVDYQMRVPDYDSISWVGGFLEIDED